MKNISSLWPSYLEKVLGIESLIFPRKEIKTQHNTSTPAPIQKSHDNSVSLETNLVFPQVFKRGSFNAKWLFITPETLPPKALKGLDKICIALHAQKNFLHLSFDLARKPTSLTRNPTSLTNPSFKNSFEHKEPKIKQSLVSPLQKDWTLPFKKWLSLSSFEFGVVFGAHLFDVFMKKRILSKNKDSEEKETAKKLIKESKNSTASASKRELKQALSFKEALTHSFFCSHRPCVITYGLEELFPPPQQENSFQNKGEKKEIVQMKKKYTWQQIQKLIQ